ncbi:DNA binding domain-containing protein, excisionase family [Roseateles sp. YR242]|uniref:helix-turn-helix domain-containing protein n=1 Tax=Roseateles sp. YR242 TaxID=1855305 RepID=UPI0008BA4F08|nr:helix-turn-helix domain-containing protein [Roseateles sp. YR242]SEK79991.1 DNA binding domain-containing protein, excisionase family [Roseateles sp. YR242]
MTTLTHAALPPPLERQFLEGIHFALDEFAKGLVAKLTQLVSEQLTGTKQSSTQSRQALENAVAAEMPAMLEQEFMSRFLSNETSARQHRAVLVHLLSAAEVQAVVGADLVAMSPAKAAKPPGVEEELTSEAAAKLLHVSRTHLNSLADSGALGPIRRTEGGHRRIMRPHLLDYLAESQRRQAEGVEDMMAATEKLGLYDDEAASVPKRPRR